MLSSRARSVVCAVGACLLTACSHLPVPHLSAQPVVGIVEYDTGLTKFSTVSGSYHQDMCSKADPDVAVHLSDKEMKAILALAQKSGFYGARADQTTDWTKFTTRPLHCAAFRLRVESGASHNEVRWDCGPDGSNVPPAQLAPIVQALQADLRSRKEVRAMPWSSCQVR